MTLAAGPVHPGLASPLREAGQGPAVVCLHANASTSAQWRSLMAALAPAYHVMAPDAYDAGSGPHWPSDRHITLLDEVDLLAPLLRTLASPAILVGHSYGGAVALMAALTRPARIRALVLYEPTLFSLVDAQPPAPDGADGIRRTVREAGAALDRGDRAAAARTFIDFWMGEGAWAATPPSRQASFTASIVNVRRWAHALFTERTPLAEFRRLDMPVLYMTGERSPPDALAVARRLVPVLPQVTPVSFPDLGHMGPLSAPDRVNDTIRRFVAALD
ncbi:MAG: alpha/beta fold hydrolase [Burkholderiales bacterium]